MEARNKRPTYLLRSSLFTSGLTPTAFLSILAIESSLNMTISWSKNLMRHGFDAKCILGTFALSRFTKEDNRCCRGNVPLTVISRGPGTNTKWVDRVIDGYEAIRSARLSKFSVHHSHKSLVDNLKNDITDLDTYGRRDYCHVQLIGW
jgi:hypothetical protein